jgi:uncharacterized membrane protein
MNSEYRTGRTLEPQPNSAYLLGWFSVGASTIAFGFFLIALGQKIFQIYFPGSGMRTGWPMAFFVIAVMISSLISLSRQLPGQNVMLGATIIATIGGIAHGIGAKTGIPFGPFSYSIEIGPKVFSSVAWFMPLIWVIAVINGRGVARLIMKPWRKTKNYGFWVIGVTAVLVLFFNLALEPFATRTRGYWVWTPTKFPLAWYGMPLINSISWALLTGLALAFATPSLINKHSRARKLPRQYHPLYTWVLLFALFATGCGFHALWSAMWLAIGTAMLSIVLAIRGARW